MAHRRTIQVSPELGRRRHIRTRTARHGYFHAMDRTRCKHHNIRTASLRSHVGLEIVSSLFLAPRSHRPRRLISTRQPEPTQTAMSSHRLLGIMRAGGLEPARSGEQRGNQNPVASKEKDPHRDQQPVRQSGVKVPRRSETRRRQCGARLRRSSLTTSCALGPDGEASGDSRPAE